MCAHGEGIGYALDHTDLIAHSRRTLPLSCEGAGTPDWVTPTYKRGCGELYLSAHASLNVTFNTKYTFVWHIFVVINLRIIL